MTMNHRSTQISRRNASAASAAGIIPDGSDHDDDDVGKLHGAVVAAASGDHSEDSACFATQQKHKDYRYDRNTILIGIAVFLVYELLKNATGLGYYRNAAPPPMAGGKQPPLSAPDPIDVGGSVRMQRTIEVPDPPPAVVPPEGFAADAAVTAKKNPLPRRHHLDLQSRNGTLVTLVHIGKTGGSALRDLIDYAAGYCKTNYLRDGRGDGSLPLAEGSLFRDAHLHDRTTLQKHMCALARITSSKRGSDSENGLVHLDRNLGKTLSDPHFLIPIRNPVDRLVSWFHYERHFQTVKRTRYSSALNELIDPARCNFSTVDEVFSGRRRGVNGDGGNSSDAAIAPPEEPSETHRRFGADRPAVATAEYCRRLSRDCLSGAIPCYGHNFFNYEYYLEDILVRVLRGRGGGDNETMTTTAAATNVRPRIDVIRAERSWDDLNRTLADWTGSPMTPDMDFFYLNRKPFDVDTRDHDKTVSPDTARSLCESICPELVAYVKIVRHASNLPPEEKTSTLRELDGSCGGASVESVCGRVFRYRRIRAAKDPVLCEPRRHPEEENGDGVDGGVDDEEEDRGDAGDGEANATTTTVDRRRRLAYLRGDDLPSC